MSIEILRVRSSITSALKQLILLRGTAFAALGGAIILYCGAFLSVKTLSMWGLAALLLGLILIALGLIPYRKLSRLEVNPYEIVVDDNFCLFFLSKKKPLFALAMKDIEKMEYVDGKKRYGIALCMKKSHQTIHPLHSFDVEAFQRSSKKMMSCDLFLPYFSKRSYAELQELQQ